jgi:hypothetical protein
MFIAIALPIILNSISGILLAIGLVWLNKQHNYRNRELNSLLRRVNLLESKANKNERT